MACVVKGYEEAVAKEQLARNVAYLDIPEIVCGERLRNISPRIYSVLSSIRSPFCFGGSYSLADVARFLWICHWDYSAKAWWKKRQLVKRASRLNLTEAYAEINSFLELTFMDAPKATNKNVKPIASETAWLVFQFRGEPWRNSEQQTLDTPFRKLYQENRCWLASRGEVVMNDSDKKKGSWLEDVNEALRNGDITHEQLEEYNRRCRQSRN